MKVNEQAKSSPEAALSQEAFVHANSEHPDASFSKADANTRFDDAINSNHDGEPKNKWQADAEQILELGKQFLDFGAGLMSLARAEALLSVRTFPKLLMLWLLMVPVILMTWCAFSVLLSWMVTAASNQIGLGIFTFFLLQLLLLLMCYWLIVRYRARIGFSYTRTQFMDFIRSIQYEINSRDKTKE